MTAGSFWSPEKPARAAGQRLEDPEKVTVAFLVARCEKAGGRYLVTTFSY